MRNRSGPKQTPAADGQPASSRKRLLRVVQLIWIAALIAALVYFAQTNKDAIATALGNLALAWIPLMLGVEVTRRFIGSWRWAYLANGARWRVDRFAYWTHARFFFLSNLFGYIPVFFATLATRMELYKQIGVRRVETVGLHIAESALLALSSIPLIALALPLFAEVSLSQSLMLAAALALVCVAVLHPALLARLYLLLGRDAAQRPSTAASFTLLGFGIVAKVLSGVLLILVLAAFGINVSTADAIALIGLVAGAWLIGALAVWAPAGLGVRDGILAAGVLHLAPPETAVLVSVIARLASLVVDLLLGAIAALVGRAHNPDEEAVA